MANVFIRLCGSVFLVLLFIEPVQATIYKYVDGNGVAHFTNVPSRPGYETFHTSKKRQTASQPEFRYDTHIKAAARLYDLDPFIIKAIIKAESNFDKYALSSKGAQGLMQLMPDTARDMNVVDAYDPKENIFGGTRYFKKLYKVFDGDLRLALASYNAGLEKVKHTRSVPDIRETRQYIKRVLSNYKSYQKAL